MTEAEKIVIIILVGLKDLFDRKLITSAPDVIPKYIAIGDQLRAKGFIPSPEETKDCLKGLEIFTNNEELEIVALMLSQLWDQTLDLHIEKMIKDLEMEIENDDLPPEDDK